MFLTVSTTHTPATDLGYLLHKHPDRVQTFSHAAGQVHVFYPEAGIERCTAAVLLEVDPIGLVRRERKDDAFALGQYVNDRPYAASSLLAVAVKDVFRTALTGRCDARPELAAGPLPLQITLAALPCRHAGPDLVRRLFEPLGWSVDVSTAALDATVPEWGDSPYVDVTVRGELRLADALNQIYVLLPVLDDAKHYWVGPDEVDKLIRAGAGWLATHPARELISARYLAHRRTLTRSALERLAEVEDVAVDDLDDAVEPPRVGDEPDRPVRLADQRRGTVLAALRSAGAKSVGDLGCGGGALLRDLVADPGFERIVAVDVSTRALHLAARLLERVPEHRRERVEVFQSSLLYRDERLRGLDAAVLMEVIEHVDPSRLTALERCVFGDARPATVVVTTPNVEYNVRFETLPAGQTRHRDHRFEWTRAEFAAWCSSVGERFGYAIRHVPIGDDDPEVGPPSQLAVFTRDGAA